MQPGDSNKTIYSHLKKLKLYPALFWGPSSGVLGFIIKGVKIESLKKVWKLISARRTFE